MAYSRNQYSQEWAIRPFPQPHVIAEFPDHGPECLCTWAWAPSITGSGECPFIIKFANRLCRHHAKDYYPGL